VRTQAWRLAGCACPDDAKARERCNSKWIRCNERLAYLRPTIEAVENERKAKPASPVAGEGSE
jgi:hypothetical protein